MAEAGSTPVRLVWRAEEPERMGRAIATALGVPLRAGAAPHLGGGGAASLRLVNAELVVEALGPADPPLSMEVIPETVGDVPARPHRGSLADPSPDLLPDLRPDLLPPAGGSQVPRLLAVAWATVELDRAAEELAAALPGCRFMPGPADPVLGAATLMEIAEPVGRPRFVLVEPSTESLLAATLARFGEGPVGCWVALDPASPSASAIAGTGHVGPFGPERRAAVPGRFGPHLIVVAAAATRADP